MTPTRFSTTEHACANAKAGRSGVFVALALLAGVGTASAQLEVRRYEAGVTSALEDSERGGAVTISVQAILQDSVPWVGIEVESGTDATVTLSLPIGNVRAFLAADPASFIVKTVNVPTDEDRTEVSVPAFTRSWGDYFGLVRKDWWDASKIAFLFRQGGKDTIMAEGEISEVTAVLEFLANAETRIANWEAGG